MTQQKLTYEVYTDGACKGNPGPGGWGVVVVSPDGHRTRLSGRKERTTNQQMELRAAIEGLEVTPEGAHVTVHSDSTYLVNTMTHNWKRRANLDLWANLDTLAEARTVRWEWVRGHAGHPENEEANALAQQEAGTAKGRPPSEETPALTHLDEQGRARMVDVGWKGETEREAVAKGSVVMTPETLRLITEGGLEKGDALGVARLAGVMGAKLTPQLIPLSHPIPLDQVMVELEADEEGQRHPHHRHGQGHRSHGSGDGGAGGGNHGSPDPLRHGQGGGSEDAYPGRAPGTQAGRQERRDRTRIARRAGWSFC